MIKYTVYFLSYFYIMYIFLSHLIFKKKISPQEFFILLGVALTPIGKLFYLPVPGLDSVKMSFIYFSLTSSLFLLLKGFSGIKLKILFPFFFLIPPVLSIVLIDSSLGAWFMTRNPLTGAGDTPLLRVVSVFFLAGTASYCAYYIAERPEFAKNIATMYVASTLFASFVGSIIYYGLVTGQLTIPDIEPISLQVHFGGITYRFNPGANVNEFGQIAGYAIILLKWVPWGSSRKALALIILMIAEFLALTRGAWVALICSYAGMILITDQRTRRIIIVLTSLALVAFAIAAVNSDYIGHLIATRTATESNISVDERLYDLGLALDELNQNWVRLLFGFGWSADFWGMFYGYGFDEQHDVPAMILFDTGIIGLSIYLVILTMMLVKSFTNTATRDVCVGLLIFYCAASATEHNFYHTQTWVMFGLIVGCGFAGRPRNLPQASGHQG
jgi:hypothetical protein